MIPVRSDVTTLVLSILGDTQVSGGGIFTSAFQAPYLNSAYQELFGRLSNISAPRAQREAYYIVPAYTGSVTPSIAGISNFGSPLEIRERGTVTGYAISAATPATPAAGSLRLTVAALPAAVITGAQADVYSVAGITAEVNDSWTLTVQSTVSVDLNGCAATGTYTSGGVLAYSTEQWSNELTPKGTTDEFPNSASAAFAMYCWQNGALRLPAAVAAREIRIVYYLSSSLPVVASPVAGDSMGIDDSLNFLANRTAQLCAVAKAPNKVDACRAQADYFLNMMVNRSIRDEQSGEVTQPPPSRPRRGLNVGLW